MTGGAGVVEGMARHAGALIQHCQAGMGSVLEQGERNVSSGQLIVAAATVVGGVTGGAVSAIQSGIATMDIILPARGVGDGLHYLMAGCAAVPCYRLG